MRKMQTRLEEPVSYAMSLDKQPYSLNSLLGKPMRLKHSGNIFCVACGRKTNKSFNQGYCYSCFTKLAQCDTCIMSPELCHYHKGTCREPAWGEQSCMQDHIVYLANSSGLKVGITRATQVPTRWIDQGATQALAIIRVRNRLQSGNLEVMFKQHVSDKTNWRDMLKGDATTLSMQDEAQQLLTKCRTEINELETRFGFFAISILNGIEPVTIKYPVQSHPTRITSLNLDKQATVEGTLLGIKGQYLIFDCGVINLRRFTGYEVTLMH